MELKLVLGRGDCYAGRSGLPSLSVIAPHTGSHCSHRCAPNKENSSELVTFSVVSQLLNTVSQVDLFLYTVPSLMYFIIVTENATLTLAYMYTAYNK